MLNPPKNDDNDINESIRWANEINKKNKQNKIGELNKDQSWFGLSLFKLPIIETVVGISVMAYLANIVYTSKSLEEEDDTNIINAMNKRSYLTPIDE